MLRRGFLSSIGLAALPIPSVTTKGSRVDEMVKFLDFYVKPVDIVDAVYVYFGGCAFHETYPHPRVNIRYDYKTVHENYENGKLRPYESTVDFDREFTYSSPQELNSYTKDLCEAVLIFSRKYNCHMGWSLSHHEEDGNISRTYM